MHYSYVIYFQSDGERAVYKVKDGISNSIKFSDSNAANILQSVLTDLGTKDTTGGSIFIKRPSTGRTFDFDTEVTMPNGSQDIIIESDGAEFRRTENINSIINTNGNAGPKIFKGLRFNGNSATTTTTTLPNRGIYINGGSNATVEDCYFTNYGAQVHPVGAANCSNVILQRNKIGQCGGFGSEGGCSNLQILNNYWFAAGGDYPLVAAGNINKNTGVVIAGNLLPFGSTSGGGIDVVASGAMISNNYIKDAYQHSIYVHDNNILGGADDPTFITISNNVLIGGGSLGGASITIETGNNSVDNNVHITNNYCDKGMVFANARKITINNNILNKRIYVIRGQRFTIYGNQFYTGKGGAVAVEPNAAFGPILDKLMFANNLLEVGGTNARAIFPTGTPTNLIEQNNLSF